MWDTRAEVRMTMSVVIIRLPGEGEVNRHDGTELVVLWRMRETVEERREVMGYPLRIASTGC